MNSNSSNRRINKNADYVMSWIAMNVQKPGKRIGWAPVFQGIDSANKEIVRLLLTTVLGDTNVKTISSHDAVGQLERFAHENCCVIIIDDAAGSIEHTKQLFRELSALIDGEAIQMNFIVFTATVMPPSISPMARKRLFQIKAKPFGTGMEGEVLAAIKNHGPAFVKHYMDSVIY